MNTRNSYKCKNNNTERGVKLSSKENCRSYNDSNVEYMVMRFISCKV